MNKYKHVLNTLMPNSGLTTDKEAKEVIILPPDWKNKKLICSVWSDTGKNGTPHVLAKKTIKYGSPEFHCKIGGKDRLFKVNYRNEGLIKQDGKKLLYDTYFMNSTGGLSFHEFPEDMDSEEAYTVFKNNAVNMYVKKGGIPLYYMLIAMAVALVAFIAIVIVIPPGLQAQEQVKELDKQVTSLKQQNSVLQQQYNDLKGATNG